MSDKMSEVEAAKKAVLKRWRDAHVSDNFGTACIIADKCIIGITEIRGDGSEDSAWLDSASKLTPAAVAGDAVKMYVGDVEECRWCHFIIELRQRGEGVEWIHATNNRLWCSHEPHFAEPKIADPVGEREGDKQIGVVDGVAMRLNGVTVTYLGGVQVQAVCGCGWMIRSDSHYEVHMRAAEHTPCSRKVWNAALASKQSAEGIPERPKATGNFGGNLACNVHDVYSYCDKVEAELAQIKLSSARKDFDIKRLLECMKGIRSSFDLPPHEVMDVMAATCVPAEVEHNLRLSGACKRRLGRRRKCYAI